MMMINLNIETEKSCLLFTFLDSNETTINPTAKDNVDSVLNDKKIKNNPTNMLIFFLDIKFLYPKSKK